MRINNLEISITGKLIKTAFSRDEWYQVIEDPELLIAQLREAKVNADIFTFMQRLPETKPKYNYYMEWDNVSAIPIKSFDYWWTRQIPKQVRTKVKKAENSRVAVKVVDLNDELLKGIMSIYNETPIRQGKPFWHYGKDFDTVKKEVSTYLDASDFIGAFYKDQLIGFIKLVYAGETARMMQIISKLEHRDKAPNNALIAKAVQICGEKRIPYLVYGFWSRGSLGDFKRHNGFEKIEVPRYYIPLTIIGVIGLKLHLHHGVAGILPEKAMLGLIELRNKYYTRKYVQK